MGTLMQQGLNTQSNSSISILHFCNFKVKSVLVYLEAGGEYLTINQCTPNKHTGIKVDSLLQSTKLTVVETIINNNQNKVQKTCDHIGWF